MDSESPLSAEFPESVEPILGGTLCLMSCWASHPCEMHANRIADNLARLARHPDVSPELRIVCRRLEERWAALALQAAPRPAQTTPAAQPVRPAGTEPRELLREIAQEAGADGARQRRRTLH